MGERAARFARPLSISQRVLTVQAATVSASRTNAVRQRLFRSSSAGRRKCGACGMSTVGALRCQDYFPRNFYT